MQRRVLAVLGAALLGTGCGSSSSMTTNDGGLLDGSMTGTGGARNNGGGDGGTNGARSSGGGPSGNGGASSGGGASSTGGTNGAGGGTLHPSGGTAGAEDVDGSAGAPLDGGSRRRRPFPDTTSKISILTDQLPNLNDAQRRFVVAHFVGTEKQTLDQSRPLRALAPDFLVLHYHLSMWQSAPTTDFILDGEHWGNDYPTVNMHETWFWHDAQNQRVASTADQKLLMNISDIGWQDYTVMSLVAQLDAGDYDGVFFDSASPALLQAEVGAQDQRLAGTGARDTKLPALDNRTFIDAWQAWMGGLSNELGNAGIPLIPNTSAFVTSWDDTDYSLTAGAFVEGFADPAFATADWKASTNELLALAGKHKILILQNYLKGADDVTTRLYYLANYLLVKGDRTYLEYFSGGPLEWYPEWSVDLGAPSKTGTTVDDYASGAVYRRDFDKGAVLVNPTDTAATVTLGATFQRVVPTGGGAVDTGGTAPGSVTTSAVTSITVAAHGAELLLH